MLHLVYSSPLICEPLIYNLRHQSDQSKISVEKLSEMECLNKLETHQADLALLTPLAYGKSKGNIYVVKDYMIHSPNLGRNVLLFFKGNLTNFNTVYCEPFKKENSFEKFLADWVLREYFEIDVDWQLLFTPIVDEHLLNQLKVILLTGEKAFETFNQIDSYLDLSEEWCLRTELPLILNLLCVHSSFAHADQLASLQKSLAEGLKNLSAIAKEYAHSHSQNWTVYYDLLSKNYQYFPHPASQESLEQIFQHMFYSGIVDYLPELKIYNG